MLLSKRSFLNRYLLLAVAYYGLLSALSHIPGDVLDEIGFNVWDKAVHVAAYSVLGFLIGLWLSSESARRRPAVELSIASALVLALGAIDETHQLFVYGRYASLGDVMADLLGGMAGGGTAILLRRLSKSPSRWAKKDMSR